MNERVTHILDDTAASAIAGIGLFGIGVAVGYFFGKRKKTYIPAEKTVSVKPQLNLDEVRENLVRMQKEERTKRDIALPDEAFEDKSKAQIIQHIPTPEEDDAFAGVHVYTSDADYAGWNQDEEDATRTKMAPYVIHRAEFDSNDMDFTQVTMTYYAGDDILTGEDDIPVYNWEAELGELKFGHGSGDPSVVFIRNVRRKMEYEVLLHEGSFAMIKHGLEPENNERVKSLKHSSGPPRFRQE